MDTLPFFLVLFSAFLWGISPIITKRLIMKYERYTIMILFSSTYIFCLLMAMPFFGKELFKDLRQFNSSDIAMVLFQGVCVLFFGNVIYYYVLKNNNTSLVTALESCAPFFTLLFGYLILNEKINFNGGIGIALIVLGVIFISYNDNKFSFVETFTSRD